MDSDGKRQMGRQRASVDSSGQGGRAGTQVICTFPEAQPMGCVEKKDNTQEGRWVPLVKDFGGPQLLLCHNSCDPSVSGAR